MFSWEIQIDSWRWLFSRRLRSLNLNDRNYCEMIFFLGLKIRSPVSAPFRIIIKTYLLKSRFFFSLCAIENPLCFNEEDKQKNKNESQKWVPCVWWWSLSLALLHFSVQKDNKREEEEDVDKNYQPKISIKSEDLEFLWLCWHRCSIKKCALAFSPTCSSSCVNFSRLFFPELKDLYYPYQ